MCHFNYFLIVLTNLGKILFPGHQQYPSERTNTLLPYLTLFTHCQCLQQQNSMLQVWVCGRDCVTRRQSITICYICIKQIQHDLNLTTFWEKSRPSHGLKITSGKQFHHVPHDHAIFVYYFVFLYCPQVYKREIGICLKKSGLHIIRAKAISDNMLPSKTFTSA